MKKTGGWKRVVLLFMVLVLPAVAYVLLQTGKNNYVQLPILGEKSVTGEERKVRKKLVRDTTYHTIADFQLYNQDGKLVSQEDLKNSIYIANFFFATCPTICPKMSTQMGRLNERFKKNEDIKLVSFTVNPDADSIPVLKLYAKKYNAETPKWNFLTGDKQQIYALARNSYLVNALKGDGGPNDFIHSEMLILIDKDKRIRGFYDGTSKEETDKLINEIKVLIMEYLRKVK